MKIYAAWTSLTVYESLQFKKKNGSFYILPNLIKIKKF